MLLPSQRGHDSSVGAVMGYALDGRDLIPSKSKIFLFSIASRPAQGPTQPPIQCIPRAHSLGVKRLEREVDHLPLSSAEVKNGEAIPPPSMSSWHSA
jgi:hypothetical protein